MTYTASRCPCGHRTCVDWHVDGVAAIQGVHFTETQPRAVAALLNAIDRYPTEPSFTITIPWHPDTPTIAKKE